jgi:hypothetical protein
MTAVNYSLFIHYALDSIIKVVFLVEKPTIQFTILTWVAILHMLILQKQMQPPLSRFAIQKGDPPAVLRGRIVMEVTTVDILSI